MTTVLTSPWPRIPEDEREVAQVIAAAVQRGRGGEPASVQHEERLGDDVALVIARAVASPQASGLPLAVVSELAANPGFRATAQRNATILASHLYPLSLLIYGADLENITCLAHDHWLVSTVGRKLVGEVKDLKSRGVTFEEYDYPELKTKDGIAEGGGAKVAWFKDSEGNLLNIVQPARVPAGRTT